MDKNSIKKYAVWARNELIARVAQKANQYGITEAETISASADSIHGKLLTPIEKKQRTALIEKIKNKGKNGFQLVMEEVAYTWFNRFTAIRFMEVNGYLPSHVRVFTDEENRFAPQILAEAIHLEMPGLDMEKVFDLKQANKTEELYKYLIITQCNALNEILPGMFQRIEDYTELLLPDNLLREGSVIEQMISLIPEEDWTNQVQIIGWLYQFYNIEPKAAVFAKNGKISKEEIPAATQLFTPEWIVRYMVENSLGRLWIAGHPNDELKANWKYYLEDADQEESVKAQLESIRRECASLKPEEIKVIDPCMGSGHILCYMFDVLVQIYEAYGYTARDAVSSIVEHNIYGLDIDNRAAQLSYFAVMMKARQYDRRFFSRGIKPNVYAIIESNSITQDVVDYFVNGDETLKIEIDTIIKDMMDAKEYGSILKISKANFALLYSRFDEIENDVSLFRQVALDELLPLVKIAELITQQYSVAVTNPPYMETSAVGAKLQNYIYKNYPESKVDLYSVFIEKCRQLTLSNGYFALITMHTWMFIASFEKFRKTINHYDYISILHLGTRAFEEISGDVVQTAAYVWRNSSTKKNRLVAARLVDYTDAEAKERNYVSGNNRFVVAQENFNYLPGHPIVYWLTDEYFDALKNNKLIESYVERKAGVVTGNDPYFLRLWFEVIHNDISFERKYADYYAKYHIMSKGGSARRFYGNFEYVIKLRDLWNPSKTNVSVRRGDADYYFKKAIGWSQVGNAQKTFRYVENSVCGTATPTIYLKDDRLFNYFLGFLNTKIAYEYLTAYNPTINLLTTDICNLPIIMRDDKVNEIDYLVEDSIELNRADWDAFETSWDFDVHPFVKYANSLWDATTIGATMNKFYGRELPKHNSPIELCYLLWQGECTERFTTLKENEEELNRLFIDIYGLNNELTPEVAEKDVTVRKADLVRDIRSFISYAVGCMFGRYSLDVDGIAYAGGEWDESRYMAFKADRDNVLPICDDEYFEDDIVGKFVRFVEAVYGKDTLEENLKFIAGALGGSGSPRDVIRSYFLNDFYTDHLKIYQKRPIYWQFDSGKKNGFKCLIYMHRYQPDTIARIRTDYVHEQQARYRTAIADLEQRIQVASTSERVKLTKQLQKLKDQETEIRLFEEKVHHLADQMIRIDLDDGVKHNYEIFKDVLTKIK